MADLVIGVTLAQMDLAERRICNAAIVTSTTSSVIVKHEYPRHGRGGFNEPDYAVCNGLPIVHNLPNPGALSHGDICEIVIDVSAWPRSVKAGRSLKISARRESWTWHMSAVNGSQPPYREEHANADEYV
jgi:hypothetical protein